MHIHFTKMHGIGNDFVVIDATKFAVNLTPEQARKITDRNYGVGCDQILIVESPSRNDVLFNYRIINADGSEVEQCGNGARCFARFVKEKGLTDQTDIPVSTQGGNIHLQVQDDGQVLVDMGAPQLEPSQIPLLADHYASSYPLEGLEEGVVKFGAVSMGNPHAVVVVDNVDTAPVETLGPLMESHSQFPERVNVGFMQVVSENHIRLRVFERGAGETLACGTGACAAVVSGQLRGLLAEQVKVDLPGGTLNINWAGRSQAVMMTGPAEFVFEGTIEL